MWGGYEKDAANMVSGGLHCMIDGRTVSNEERLTVHSSVIVPTLMYRSKSWIW